MQCILGVGWDVGGWNGNKQAVAVVRQCDNQREWLGVPRSFSIEKLHQLGGSILDLVRIGWPNAPDRLLEDLRVVLAIDAPLGFPVAFQRMIGRQQRVEHKHGPEIQNPLAYRETERWVHQCFGKKPLSASFDKLGNNATVAMYHAEHWAAASGFAIAPFESNEHHHVMIEVYPALIKDAKSGECLPQFKNLLPSDLPVRSDETDAAICAVHALAYGLGGRARDVPELVGPPASISSDIMASEGWIYHFPG